VLERANNSITHKLLLWATAYCSQSTTETMASSMKNKGKRARSPAEQGPLKNRVHRDDDPAFEQRSAVPSPSPQAPKLFNRLTTDYTIKNSNPKLIKCYGDGASLLSSREPRRDTALRVEQGSCQALNFGAMAGPMSWVAMVSPMDGDLLAEHVR
jgi:hypothetical protein